LPLPFHVRSLTDYWLWQEQLINDAGGWVRETKTLLVQAIQETLDGEPRVVKFPPQFVDFGDGSALFFALTVNADMEVSRYSFHFMSKDKVVIWRKDNAHEQHGEHIHRGKNDPEPFEPVDLEEALKEATDFIRDGKLP
jgi:hypothetical protein